MDEYDVRQFVGIDLHRQRSVIVRQSESGDQLSAVRSARSRPNSRSTSQSARSIPLVTPPLVTKSPSSTRSFTSVAPVACRSSHAV